MRKTVESNAKILAIFAIICTAIVATVNLLTKDRIALQEQQQLLSTLDSIVDPTSHNSQLYQNCALINSPLLNHNTPQKAYVAMLNDTPVAYAITTTAPDGYNGNIDLIVAIKRNGSVSGVRVLKHNETPGLGDKIELRKSPWIESFRGKNMVGDIDNRWAVTKDGGMFDQFTGATITPRSVVKAVRKTVEYFKTNHPKNLPPSQTD